MWNQRSTAKAEQTNTATSDNKQINAGAAAPEDCGCVGTGAAKAGASVASTSAGVVGERRLSSSSGSGGVEQQLALKAIESNSKRQQQANTSAFGGKISEDNKEQEKKKEEEQQQQEGKKKQSKSNNSNSAIAAAINKQKEFAAQSETSDSGFISGPQSSQIFSEEIIDNNKIDNDDGNNKLDQHAAKGVSDDKNQQKQATASVIDSGIIDEEAETDTAVGNEGEGASAANNAESASEQMRFKHNVEAGIPQWTVQSTLATGGSSGMNNLNATAATANSSAGRRTTNNNSQATAAGNTATSNSQVNAWEQFYQQNDDGDTPLHLACISGYVEVVTALIRMAPHPCLLNIQNDAAQTPLHLAVLTAQPNILRMLLLAGAEPTMRDRHGNTALHLSCMAGEKQCVRALTEEYVASEIHEAHRNYGYRSNDKAVSSLSYAHMPADLEIRNYDGERCVHLAAQAGHIDILRILVAHGADINAREGKSGRTPLHIAIECCNEDLANFLLDECEKLNLETATYAGLTAYQVACILNKSRMQNILEERGAEPLTPPDSDYDSSDIEDLDETKVYDRFGDPRYFVSYSGGNPMTVA